MTKWTAFGLLAPMSSTQPMMNQRKLWWSPIPWGPTSCRCTATQHRLPKPSTDRGYRAAPARMAAAEAEVAGEAAAEAAPVVAVAAVPVHAAAAAEEDVGAEGAAELVGAVERPAIMPALPAQTTSCTFLSPAAAEHRWPRAVEMEEAAII